MLTLRSSGRSQVPEAETHLLLVEDEAPLRESWAERLAERGYHVVQAETGEAARERLAEFAFDVVITDLRLPGIDGTAVVETALERYPEIVAVVVTGYATVETAVTLIKQGVADFIEKPCPFDRLLHTLATALERRRLRSENEYLRSQLQQRYGLEGIVGESQPMHRLRALLKTVAATTSTVLITGDTGTGKELVARAIHHNSPRRDEHFVALNCSAIPETLLEAELFGHVRGAFTGAVVNRKGRFEQAHRGTAQTPPRDGVAVSQEAMRQMMMYRWPGNVRQLENVIERALALNPGRDRIEAEDLPEEVRAGGAGADAAPELPDAGMDLPAHLQRVEASLIRTALDRTGGNKQQAARLLNIKRTTLVEKAKRIDH